MRKTIALLVFGAFLLLAAGPGVAQTPAPAKAPRPAVATSQELLSAWNDVGRKLIAMAEDWPEEKYDWKPTPTVRSFAEQLLHIGGANYFFTDTALGKSLGSEDLPREKYKTKADVVAAMKKSFADGAAVIKEKGDAGLAAAVKHPFANQMAHLSSIAWDLTEHGGEHYGQLALYYRMSGQVPPESRPRN